MPNGSAKTHRLKDALGAVMRDDSHHIQIPQSLDQTKNTTIAKNLDLFSNLTTGRLPFF